MFYLNERYDTTALTTNKNFFWQIYSRCFFLLIAAVISLLVTSLAIYLLCNHKKLRIQVASPALQQIESRHFNNTGRGHYRMQNSELYKFGINCYNFQSSDVFSSTLQKTKAVHGMHVL